MTATAWWYVSDQAGGARPRDDTVTVSRGGGGGGGGGGGRGRHRQGGPVAVVTAPVVRQDVPVNVAGIGSVEAFNTVTVRARVDGLLEKIAFTEGQEVKAGDLLAQIDSRVYEARLSQAQGVKAKNEAQLANAKLDLDRAVKLGQFATQQTVDTARALVRQLEGSLQTDQANIDAAALDLEYASIRAPISGRTGVRLIDAGNFVRARESSGIVIITQLEPIYVSFSLPQQYLETVQQALADRQVPVAALDADGKRALEEGVLSVLDNRIDAQTGTIKLKATFANAHRKLWPGQFVNVRVRLDTVKDGTVVPSAAVQRNAGGTFAYVLDQDNRVEMRPIRVGQVDNNIAVVESGLEPGQQVVVTSQEQLRPGAYVIPTEAKSQQEGAVPQITSSKLASERAASQERRSSP
ncbi:efflux RND transporter periplasmic adaptor subunit [Bradyrhizobium centrolobii]|uniref:efflux RND transporter periplasmic adaptor subunit n=1 Tax=Bradyrhizobium centrolobii TaxID=1505087 RepID=UPI0024C04237|nr:efflux RND transporter periplasmic adaptor subunit [Bradyrhizobium centrolobii]